MRDDPAVDTPPEWNGRIKQVWAGMDGCAEAVLALPQLSPYRVASLRSVRRAMARGPKLVAYEHPQQLNADRSR